MVAAVVAELELVRLGAEGGGEQRGLVGGAEGAGHRTAVAQVAREPAGVDAGDAGDAGAAQEGVEVALAAPVAAAARQLTDDHAPGERPGRLVVDRRHAVVP